MFWFCCFEIGYVASRGNDNEEWFPGWFQSFIRGYDIQSQVVCALIHADRHKAKIGSNLYDVDALRLPIKAHDVGDI